MPKYNGNPQLEDGYTKIANELLEAIARTPIPARCRQIFDYIIRRIYGWALQNPKALPVPITLDEFVNGTGIVKNHINRYINRLQEMNMIKVITNNGDSRIVSYGIQKRYGEWKVSPRMVKSPSMVKSITTYGDDLSVDGDKNSGKQNDNNNLQTSKEIIKEKKERKGFSNFSNKRKDWFKEEDEVEIPRFEGVDYGD